MALTRKKYVVDKNFQYKISIKAVILPIITTLIISCILLYFANENNRLTIRNNRYINQIVDTQDNMIDMFLSTPSLQHSHNPVIQNGINTFKSNIGKLKKITINSSIITKNSSIVFIIIIIMTILQTIIIFSLFIFLSHKISGPIHVMTEYLKAIKKGEVPNFRPLRKNDELKNFYDEFCKTIEYIRNNRDK